MTFQPYQLIDFGAGRKLERFGPYVIDRPSPAAASATPRLPSRWSQAHARFERDGTRGAWTSAREMQVPWTFERGDFSLELKLTEFGHLGIFPEQRANWQWIAEQVVALDRPKLLNLFAYTGASTLAAAAAGASVVHVDAAANVVAWARRNSELSGLSDAPVRWIVDDALKFVRREIKRGQLYDAVLLDPPAYGHGPKGQHWKLEQHLGELLDGCFELCQEKGKFLLLSCHSAELGTAAGLREFAKSRREFDYAIEAIDLELESAAGDRLHSGAAVRWIRKR
jgi:23S rRNA (cytosine1962-C5)-methyltransferase